MPAKPHPPPPVEPAPESPPEVQVEVEVEVEEVLYGTVGIIGEHQPALTLVQAGRSPQDEPLPPGRVPAGAWDLYADFGDGPVRMDRVDVGAGEQVVVRCNGMKRQCTAR